MLHRTIPTQLGQLARMQYLHVEGNNIRGSMPQQICDNRAPFALLGELGADCAGAVSCQCCTCCGAINCNNFVDGTPAPTFAPNTGGAPPVSEIDVPVGLCFSGDSMVETVEHGRIPLNKLQIGDMIKNGDIVEPVYSFGHNAKDMVATFIQIHADELEKPLELSKDHLLFSRRGIVPASTIVVGDKVVTAAGNLAEVRKVESVLAKGVYAPFTPSGKIAVNGFLASNYITFQEHSESLLIGGHKIINMHWVSHIFMSPHRLLCKFDFDICKAETYTNGMNSWMVQPLRFTLDVLQQGAFIKMLVFVPLFCVVCMAFLLEQSVFLSPLLMLGVVAYILRSKALNKKAP